VAERTCVCGLNEGAMDKEGLVKMKGFQMNEGDCANAFQV